jgi:hypothetical protein
MKPEEQRIAIAGACGWKQIPDGRWNLDRKVEPFLPDYLNDLNAMHEAEKTIPIYQLDAYAEWLRNLTASVGSMANLCHWQATSAQRAEAFLRTLNLWAE